MHIHLETAFLGGLGGRRSPGTDPYGPGFESGSAISRRVALGSLVISLSLSFHTRVGVGGAGGARTGADFAAP